MIGSGIKGLIHYLFSYGHFRAAPLLRVRVCVFRAHLMLPTAYAGKDLHQSEQRL